MSDALGSGFGPFDRLARAAGRWPLGLSVFLAVASLLVAAALLLPPVRESRAALLISPQADIARLNGQSAAGVNSLAAIVDAEVDRIDSQAMAVELAGADPAEASQIARSLRAWREPGTYMVHVAARSPNALDAQRLVQSAVAAYLAGAPAGDVALRPGSSVADLLGEQAATARKNLDAKIAERDRIAASPEYRAALVAPGPNPGAAPARARLAAARTAESAAARQGVALKAFWRSGVASADIDKLRASGLFADLGGKAARLSSALEQYQAAIAATAPDAVASSAPVQELRFQVETSLALLTAELESDVGRFAAEAREAEAAYSAANVDISGATRLRLLMQTLDKEIVEGRGAVEALSRAAAEAASHPAAGSVIAQLTDVRVVAQASAGVVPATRRLPVLIGGALAIALLLSLTTLAAAELLSKTITGQREVESLLGAPVLASTPRIPASLLRGLSPNERHPAYYVIEHPAAPFADSLRELHTEIFAGLAPGAHVTLAVTAAQPGDGATTVALALARTAVAAGQRVLLIDGDLTSAGLTQVLNIEPTPGIEAVLGGQHRILDLVISDDVSAGHVLVATSDPGPTGALSLSQLNALKAALETARPVYDAVIIDCPSPLSGARSRALARLADRTIVVAAVNVTRRSLLLSLARRLEQGGAKVAGAVLNFTPMPRGRLSPKAMKSRSIQDIGFEEDPAPPPPIDPQDAPHRLH